MPKMLSGIKTPLQVGHTNTVSSTSVTVPSAAFFVILFVLFSIFTSHIGQYSLATISPPSTIDVLSNYFINCFLLLTLNEKGN
jgi:hypothetical protein